MPGEFEGKLRGPTALGKLHNVVRLITVRMYLYTRIKNVGPTLYVLFKL